MIFNWTYGMEANLDLAARTYTGIESTQTLSVPLTLVPLAILLRTSSGGNAELCAYYRADQDGEYTLRVSVGATTGRTRLDYIIGDTMTLTCSGGTAAQPASLECIVLGVKQ